MISQSTQQCVKKLQVKLRIVRTIYDDKPEKAKGLKMKTVIKDIVQNTFKIN